MEILRHTRDFHDLAMTLIFDLGPWKPFQQWPLTGRLLVPSFIEICPLNEEISRHMEWVLTNRQGTAGQTDDAKSLPPIVVSRGYKL